MITGISSFQSESNNELESRRRRSLISDFAIPSPFYSGSHSSSFVDLSDEAARSALACETGSPTIDENTEKRKNAITDRLETVEKEKKNIEAQLAILTRKRV
ncbi:hypothetical protein AB6A40_010903 [Gnathostoma spinigerum]|uniref:Uncharacterized protein n=1 Tax=Gnathostoma spinigerum TaxID=75299 RepID=A0ABD6EW60_9BILA